MRIKNSYILYYFLLILWIPGDALCSRVSHLNAHGEQQTTCKVKSGASDRFVIEVTFPGFTLQQDSLVPAFHTIHIPGCDLSALPNEPQLPVWTRLLAAPQDREFVIEHITITERLYTTAESGLTGPIKPAPASIRVGGSLPVAAVEMSDVYTINRFYPQEPVKIHPGGIMRDRRVARLQIMPALYNPQSGEIRMITRLECTIKMIDSVPIRRKAGPLSHFDRVTKENALFLQPQADGVYEIPEPPGYLIITPDAFIACAEQLAEWKAQKGYNVHIAPLSVTGSHAQDIKDYISQACQSWPVPPDYVLLAGDITHIPAFAGQFSLNPHVPHYTDLYYATLDGPGDIFPDLFIGRLPAADTTQLRIMIDKIIAYEQLTAPDRSWLEHATFIATKDVNFHEFVEKGHRNTIAHYFTPHLVQTDSIWTYYNNNRQQLNDAIDRGASMVVYSGHGSEMTWDDLDDYSLVDLYYLQNRGRYPVTLSFGCNAGAFAYKTEHVSECLGESFLSYEQRGAVLFWGAAALAFWHQDYYLQQQFFYAAFNKGYESIGQMTVDALLQLYSRGYPYSDFYQEIYNVLGDPALPLWRGAPEMLWVTHPQTLAAGAEQLEITVTDLHGPVDGALAAVSQNGRLLGAAVTQKGNAVIALPSPLSRTLMLTVSKAQHTLYQTWFDVPAAPQVIFTPDTLLANTEQGLHVQVDDPSGAPLVNYKLSIAGIGLSLVQATTNVTGTADMVINCPYGQLLDVNGIKPADPVSDYAGHIPVKSELKFADTVVQAATPFIKLDSTLAPGIPGEITVTSQPMPEKIFVRGCGIDTVYTTANFSLVPQTYGKFMVYLGAAGYELYQREINVCDARAEITGTVQRQEDSLVLAQAYIRLKHLLSGDVQQTISDNYGVFTFTEVTAGFYSLYVYKKGFTVYTDSLWIAAGRNGLPVNLPSSQPCRVSGIVTLGGANDSRGTIVRVKGQGLADTTLVTGEYTLQGALPDTLTIIAQHDGFSSASRQVIAAAGASIENIDFTLQPGISLFNETFDQDDGEFNAAGLWQWGAPQPGLHYHGPDKAYSGSHVWGTVLDGDYEPFADYRLDSPDISLVGYVKPILQFYHYYYMDYLNTGYDGGNVKISDDGGLTWAIITPYCGYPSNSLDAGNAALAGQPAFSGYNGVWQQVQFDLRPWVDRHIRLRFHFGSTGQAEDVGWYIDNVAIYDSTTVDIHENKTVLPARYVLQQNYPNPFNAETVIGYELPENSYVKVAVYNTLGQKVKTLVSEQQQPGRYRTHWQGTNESGHPVCAGIYLVRLETVNYLMTKKIVLLR